MPSKPKGRSEYKTNFKWFESFRDKEFKPSPEQIAPAAGQHSVFSKISDEPALQHKKRVEGPPTSFSINFDDGNYRASDDFALLGQQQKFASNVQYGLRPAKVSKAAEKGKELNSNNNSANLPPPPKQMRMEEKQSRARRKLDVSEGRSKKVSSKENLTPTSPPPAPRPGKRGDQQAVKEGLRDKNLSDILPKAKTAAKGNMNEGVQTDMDKGVAVSSQEAPADYSLKYKAGIAPARVTKKASEYQKEYSWKKGVPASPLLSAEQIVYNSNAQISPLKKAVVPKRTEYQMQFKTYKMPEVVSLAPKPSQEPPVQRGRSKTQMKRSKSVGAFVSPDRMQPAGSAPVTSADDPRLLRESRNSSPVPKVPVSHGKLKHVASEYRSNFRSPAVFSYESGAWKNAYPPQLLQTKNGSEKKADPSGEEDAPLSSWFAEVLELRRRANEYKRRAQGTHFSREHLVQLLAQQTGYWDADTARSSTVASLDALALEPAKPAGLPSFKSKTEGGQTSVAMDKMSMMAIRGDSTENGDDSASTVCNSQQPTQKGEKMGKRGRKGKRSRMAWQAETASERESAVEEQEAQDTNQNAACDAQSTEDVDEMGDAEEQGRLPTPILRQQREKVQRHHLDRTTPSVGGVLLSVPEQLQFSARSGDGEETVTESQPSPKAKFSTEKLHTSPLLGKPTPDTHALRDDGVESDQALDTQYIASPQVTLAKSGRNLKALQRRLNAKVPATIDERMGETYNKDLGNFHVEDLPLGKLGDKDDDVLSLSAMSIASSGSLASEVYERARRRRDQFWGKPKQ